MGGSTSQQDNAPKGESSGYFCCGSKSKAETGVATLGVIRVESQHEPVLGDIACGASYSYKVYYRVVPGLKHTMCRQGKMPPEVEQEFIRAVVWLDGRGVNAITGDSNHMVHFQSLAKKYTKLPVFFTPLAQLPLLKNVFGRSNKQIAVVDAGETTKQLHGIIKEQTGVTLSDAMFLHIGCRHVLNSIGKDKGGDNKGEENDDEDAKTATEDLVGPMVEKAKWILLEYPRVAAFLLTSTELSPYAAAMRAATRMPVFDALTCADHMIAGFRHGAAFGPQGWQKQWAAWPPAQLDVSADQSDTATPADDNAHSSSSSSGSASETETEVSKKASAEQKKAAAEQKKDPETDKKDPAETNNKDPAETNTKDPAETNKKD